MRAGWGGGRGERASHHVPRVPARRSFGDVPPVTWTHHEHLGGDPGFRGGGADARGPAGQRAGADVLPVQR